MSRRRRASKTRGGSSSATATQPGCEVEFEDAGFAAGARDTLYYVRALQEPTPQINGDPLRCARDADGRCSELDRCRAGSADGPEDDDCLSPANARAWSSPIYVDFAAGS